MAKLTFFSVLKSNLSCAFCKNFGCSVRYMPDKRKSQYYNGSQYVTKCEKDRKSIEVAILKNRLH